jgi:Na+-transporting NADH:ubiquinone oxidoreductase subunit C
MEKTGRGLFPLYVIEKDGQKRYIIPLLGRGLWGSIWGTIALRDDFSTVAGVTFGHKSETPGLGAEIAMPAFQQQFDNKKIFSENGDFVSIQVLKGGVKSHPSVPEIHGVDAISGGTITSDGTNNMISSNLRNYLPYFNKMKENGNSSQ